MQKVTIHFNLLVPDKLFQTVQFIKVGINQFLLFWQRLIKRIYCRWHKLRKKLTYDFLKLLSLELVLVLVGLSLIYVPKILKTSPQSQFNPVIYSYPNQNELSTEIAPAIPDSVVIPQINLDLNVKEASVSGNNWDLFDDQASWLVTSAKPGETGNVVIYAHNRRNLFSGLYGLKIDQFIYILTVNGWYRYQVTEAKYVQATAIEEVMPTSEPILTLYTCGDFLDFSQTRLVIKAKLISQG